MSETNMVRASRDGDQFHYSWAARRCLLLLSPDASLRAVTIEGSSPSEATATDRVVVGEELIDVGEYYGSENLEQATLIRYIQLKHSTLRVNEVWQPSGLEKTLAGFAARYRELLQHFHQDELLGKLEFWFVSNRHIAPFFLEAIQDAAAGDSPRHSSDHEKLEKFTSLCGIELSVFCRLLRLEGGQEGLWSQQNILAQEVSNYLPGADVDIPIRLKELVTRKALSESGENPAITRMDVLRALRTDESRLFPAPCLVKDLQNVVPREQEAELLRAIVEANGIPAIVHAAGGVGKSVFSTRIRLGLPTGSWSVLYDCFGNGQYRSASGYRHRHKDALVQISNELASRGLCHPLVPSSHAEPSDYVKAFLYRLQQSITSLRSANPESLLCIVVDAADNAQMAAEEIGESRSFIRDLIREKLPEGVRLVAVCRTHRQAYLDPAPDTLRLELRPFRLAETKLYLRQVFTDATEQDVEEFHRLTSQNPRVQALAIGRKLSLEETLRALGPNPTTTDDAIENLLNTAVAKLTDAATAIEKAQIHKICTALAALRPLIPLSVLASMSGVDEAAIKSFAFDLGRPLIVTGDTIQFFDEPAETWFRDKFRPSASDLATFTASLKPFAASSAYVASALPQLMLEAGHLAELVELALSSDALPSEVVEKRDVELQRLQFALKASLRAKRYVDAAKLALKAGGASAGDERRLRLLQSNTDLASLFMDSGGLQELVSRRSFGSGWVGSHYIYEAALLSGREELLGEARSRLRMAREWLKNWSQLPAEKRQQERVQDEDILEMATAAFNIQGAEFCARDLRKWQPRAISFRVGRLLARRFIDHGRYTELDELALAAKNDLYLILAIVLELREVHRTAPMHVVKRVFRLILNLRRKRGGDNHRDAEGDAEGDAIRAITALVESAYKLSVGSTEELIAILTRCLPASPPTGLSSRYGKLRFPFLRAYALRAALQGRLLNLIDLADDDLRKELENSGFHSRSQDTHQFKEDIGTLLPWHMLWATTFVSRVPSVDLATETKTRIASAITPRNIYQDDSHTSDEVARVWFDIILISEIAEVETFERWASGLRKQLFTTTLAWLARLAGQSHSLKGRSLEYAHNAFKIIQNEREDAESISSSYVELARAVLTVSCSEASAYFEHAMEVASKVGDENLDRWDAHLHLADRAASHDTPHSLIAYRLSRCAELTYEYVVRDKHFDWKATVEAIVGLCGNSSLAILSRWRDRNFGAADRILPIAVNFLLARSRLDPKVALALVGFRAQWNEPYLLRSVLADCSNTAEKEAATEFVYHYMKLDRQSSRTWRELHNVLLEHSMSVTELKERVALSEREEHALESTNRPERFDDAKTAGSQDEKGWNTIFDSIDLCIADDISRAYRRFMNFDPPYYHDRFFAESCRRVQGGKEAEFVTALAQVREFDLYLLGQFLEQYPERWTNRLGVKNALAKTLKAVCQRYCLEVRRSRYNGIFSFKTACELSGLAEAELVDAVLMAIGKKAEVVGPDRLFSLVGLLATKLTETDALNVLSFGLDLFDSTLENSDGDGPWSPKLAPPDEINSSIAGYIWGCLAAPHANLRWEAAHVVRALCTLKRGNVIGRIVALAKGAPVDAFADSRLHFYKLHALQWFLIGLTRAARDCPDVVAPHCDFLIELTFNNEPHVLIREFAKKTIAALLDAGFLVTKDDLRGQIDMVNKSPFPTIESKRHQRFKNQAGHVEGEPGTIDADCFDYDINQYWFTQLGECFAKSQVYIQREALNVIKGDWQFSEHRRWDQDERHRLGIFKEMESYHSHGSYPHADDLNFYHSYHATMVVAAKLLATTPVHREPEELEDALRHWLVSHSLSRTDGGWLADRRDPMPLEKPDWKHAKESDDWCLGVVRSDFDRILLDSTGWASLWGGWRWTSGYREESVCIRSAFVSSDRSMALLRALQTAVDPNDYLVPDANDDLQINVGGFQLKGWIVDHASGVVGIDQQDPWSGSICYPAPAPADYVAEVMGLTSDRERRRWTARGCSADVASSQVWGHFQQNRDEERNRESGSRFRASFEFIAKLLQAVRMDLMVEIQIERRQQRVHSEGDKHDTRPFSSSRILFLVKSDGSITTL